MSRLARAISEGEYKIMSYSFFMKNFRISSDI
jgi:hypothetical protein